MPKDLQTIGKATVRKMCKKACLLVLIAPLVWSMPDLVMTETDWWKSNKYPLIYAKIWVDVNQNTANQYHISLAIIIMLLLIYLVVLYTLIWNVTRGCSLLKIYKCIDVKIRSVCNEEKKHSIISRTTTSSTSDPVSNKEKEMERAESFDKYQNREKITLAFSLIHAVFLKSYIPYLDVYIVFSKYISTCHKLNEV